MMFRDALVPQRVGIVDVDLWENDGLESVIAYLLPSEENPMPGIIESESALVQYIFEYATGHANFIEYFEGKYAEESTKPPKCGAEIKSTDGFCYRCFDCQESDGVILCKACFDRSDHTGHRVQRDTHNVDGTCDCGEADLLNPQGFCPDHTGICVSCRLYHRR